MNLYWKKLLAVPVCQQDLWVSACFCLSHYHEFISCSPPVGIFDWTLSVTPSFDDWHSVYFTTIILFPLIQLLSILALRHYDVSFLESSTPLKSLWNNARHQWREDDICSFFTGYIGDLRNESQLFYWNDSASTFACLSYIALLVDNKVSFFGWRQHWASVERVKSTNLVEALILSISHSTVGKNIFMSRITDMDSML